MVRSDGFYSIKLPSKTTHNAVAVQDWLAFASGWSKIMGQHSDTLGKLSGLVYAVTGRKILFFDDDGKNCAFLDVGGSPDDLALCLRLEQDSARFVIDLDSVSLEVMSVLWFLNSMLLECNENPVVHHCQEKIKNLILEKHMLLKTKLRKLQEHGSLRRLPPLNLAHYDLYSLEFGDSK
jgi:hypothetical protein